MINSFLRVLIVRPYAGSSSSRLHVDRAFLLGSELHQFPNVNVTMLVSDISHPSGQKMTRKEQSDFRKVVPFIRFLPSISYSRSLGFRRLLSEVIYSLFLIPALIRSRPSCILVVEPLFFTGWVCLAYGALVKIKVFSDLWDLWPEAFPVNKVSALKFAFPWDIIFAPLLLSRYFRFLLYQRIYIVSNSYKQILPPSSISRAILFYHCIGNTAFEIVSNNSSRSTILAPAESGSENLLSPFKLCYVGTLGAGCALEEVIEAIKELNHFYPKQFELHVAGSLESFYRLFKEEHLPPNIKHSGFLSSFQLEDFYSRMHAILMPYKRFSPIALPVKFFDGLRYSKPFVSSLTLEVSSIIDAERIGINYHAGDVQSLVEAVVRVRDEYPSFLSSINNFSRSTDIFDAHDIYSSFASDVISSCAS